MLQAGIQRIQGNLATFVKKGRLSDAAAKAAAGRLTGALTYDDFQKVDLVIEAAVEVGTSMLYAMFATGVGTPVTACLFSRVFVLIFADVEKAWRGSATFPSMATKRLWGAERAGEAVHLCGPGEGVPHALFCVCFLDWLLNQHHFPAAQNVPVKQSIFADLEKACRTLCSVSVFLTGY